MARKKAEKPEMPAAEVESDLKAVRLYLPREHHKLLRQLAAANETNMAIMARRIVMQYLDNNARGTETVATGTGYKISDAARAYAKAVESAKPGSQAPALGHSGWEELDGYSFNYSDSDGNPKFAVTFTDDEGSASVRFVGGRTLKTTIRPRGSR